MARVSVRGRHRALPLYRPARIYLWAMLLLAVCAGLSAAAADEAVSGGDRVWMWLFVASACADTALYFHCAWLWVLYPDEGHH